jgi:chromate transporter
MTLWEPVLLIFAYNARTFGNGPVMVPLLQRSLVEERHVLTAEQLLYAFAIARVTPGQANVYVAAIGYMLFGLAGAVLATLAIQLPGYAMLPLLRGYERVRAARLVQAFTRGLTSTSVGLIAAATLGIASATLTAPTAQAVGALTLVLHQGLRWNTILSLLAASGAGLLLDRWL